MRIAICDDDPREQKQFDEALQEWDPTQNAEKFFSGEALLKAARNLPHFDIVFLDIYMPGENGVEIAGKLRAVSPETGIAFVTTSPEYAVEAFSLRALHYLVKPVTAEDIDETFQRLQILYAKQASSPVREKISFVVGPERYTVFLDQICLLENENHAVNVSLSDGRRLKVWMTFHELEQKLDGSFLKINRGIIVNMDYIIQMGPDICILRTGNRLPIAIRQSAVIRAAYDDYVFERLARHKEDE